MKLNAPNLYIEYRDADGNFARKGPFYTASPGIRIVIGTDQGMEYTVQDANLNFRKLIVPYYHTLTAVIPAK